MTMVIFDLFLTYVFILFTFNDTMRMMLAFCVSNWLFHTYVNARCDSIDKQWRIPFLSNPADKKMTYLGRDNFVVEKNSC